MIKEKVVVIGGGVGGLTAAHELIERDFEVEVYERHAQLGGKAASGRDSSNLPTEHGFRFFPSWYRNLPDTMSRIPCPGLRGMRDPSNVADRLVPVHQGLLAFYAREPMPWVTHVPRTMNQARTQASFFTSLSEAGLAPSEFAFLGQKLAEFFAMPDSMRLARYEGVTWWKYLEAEGKSAAYQNLVEASTRLIVAARPRDASAYSIGRLVLRTFSDAWTTVDRVLDGPTSEVWIDPWVDYLRGCGARFHLGWELDSIEFCPGSDTRTDCGDDREPGPCGGDCRPGPSGGSLNVISHVLMSRVVVHLVARLAAVMASLRAFVNERKASEAASRAVRSCRELATAVLADLEWRRETAGASTPEADASPPDPRLARANRWLKRIRRATKGEASVASLLTEFRVSTGKDWGATDFLEEVAESLNDVAATNFARPKEVRAQYFVFALPVEQLAYYANRTAAMTFHDPSLDNLLRLTPYLSWMSGIQFYLQEPCHLVEGHLLCMDSEWSLTAIEQTQFWGDTDLTLQGSGEAVAEATGKKIKAVLSVDISTWNRPGRFVPREAFNCTRDEIAREAWGQLKASVTRLTKATRLRDDMLFGGPALRAGVNFSLDANMADIYDPKKQAEYERARGLDVEMTAATGYELPFISGVTREFNSEPMLLNAPGTRALRPEERTEIENMFLAADYIRTDTDLACMEGANEAGRRAANAVLQASGSLHPPCRVWTLSTAREALAALGRMMGNRTGAWELANQSVRTAGQLVDTLLGVTGLTRLRPTRSGHGPQQ